MKAAVLYEVNKPLVIEDVSLQKPGPREVLIRTSVAGLCHSDLHFMEGLYPHPLPAVLGHEFAGVVEQVGSDVTYVKPGDHVVTCLSVFCGTCDNCTTGRPVLCTDTTVKMLPGASNRLSWARSEKLNQFLNLSSFAEQMLVHENAIVKIRKDMPLDLAALIGCGVITGYGAVVNTAKVAPGESVVVIGCGGVGMAAINGAQIAGAGRIIAVDTNPAKLQLATKLGATDIVDPRNGDVVQQVRDLTGGGVHHSFEVLGRKETAEQAFAMLAPGGTATIVGMIPFGQKIELHGFDFLRERKIQGSSMGSNHFRVDMPRLVEFYMRGRLHLEDWISAKLKLSEINEGFAAMKAGKTVRSVIVFDSLAVVPAFAGTTLRMLSPRHMRRHREPAAVLPRPAIGVAAGGLLAVGRRVAGARVDDGKIAHQANLDVMGFEIADRHRHRRLLEKAGAVDQRFVGIGAIEIVGEDFVEPLDVGILDGIDVVAVQGGQFSEVVSHLSQSPLLISSW